MEQKSLFQKLVLVLVIEVLFEVGLGLFLTAIHAPHNIWILLVDKILLFILLVGLNWKLTKQKIPFSLQITDNARKYLIFIFILVLLVGITHRKYLIDAVIIGLVAATTEEYLMRGIVLVSLLELFEKSHNLRMKVLFPAIISSVLFASEHFLNLFSQNLTATVAQVMVTMGMGFVFAAIFLRTRNLLYPMIFHFCIDFFITAFHGSGAAAELSIIKAIGPMMIYFVIGFVILIPVLINPHPIPKD